MKNAAQRKALRLSTLYFTLMVLLANGGYALSQLASGTEKFISLPLLLGSVSAAIFALVVVKKRIDRSANPDRK